MARVLPKGILKRLMREAEVAEVRECRGCLALDILRGVFWEAARRQGQGPGKEYVCHKCRS